MKIEDQIDKSQTQFGDIAPGTCFSFTPRSMPNIKVGLNEAFNAVGLGDGSPRWIPPQEPVHVYPNATVVLKD